MSEKVVIRRLRDADLPAYKRLRDAMLAAHPEAFTSDAAEQASRTALSYASRLGSGAAGDASVTLGAWRGRHLAGAISCEHDARVKVRHIAQVVAMMVRHEDSGRGVGAALLAECIAQAQRVGGIELLTLSVTAGNAVAIRLYERAGFVRYGSLPRAIRVGGRYHAKDLMVLALD